MFEAEKNCLLIKGQMGWRYLPATGNDYCVCVFRAHCIDLRVWDQVYSANFTPMCLLGYVAGYQGLNKVGHGVAVGFFSGFRLIVLGGNSAEAAHGD